MNIHAQSVVSKLKEYLSYITMYERGKRLLCVYTLQKIIQFQTSLCLSTKFGQKVNHKIILEITEMIDSSQGYLKTYKLIKAFFLFSFNIVNTSFYTIFKNGLWIDAIKVKNIYICDSSS